MASFEIALRENLLKLLWIFLLFLMVSPTKVATSKDYCRNPETVADYSHKNLTYIPPLGKNIECLIFEYNDLPNVTRETFRNVSKPEIMHSLQLGCNGIYSITTDALGVFDDLRSLGLSGNPINHDMKYVLGNITTKEKLTTLKLNHIGAEAIQEDTFSLMKGNRVKELFLRSNNITYISQNFLSNFQYMRQLDLQKNHVTRMHFGRMARLYILEVTYNDMYKIPTFCMSDNSTTLLPNLHKLYVNYNKILDINKVGLRCLEKLRILEIRGNFISVLPDDMLFYVPQLYSLNAEKNTGHNSRIEPYAFRSKALGVLKIGSNGAGKTIFSSVTKTFRYVPSLVALEISYINMMDMSEASEHTLFSPLTKLKYLKCYGCQIRADPKVILADKPMLDHINLNKNDIEHISNGTFKSMSMLKKLSIDMNKIGHLKESEISVDFLNSLDSLDLSGNPFICDCELKWFITWLKSTKKTIIKQYPEGYVCAYPSKRAGKKLDDVHFTYRECHPYAPWEWACFIGGPIIVVLAIISFVLYRKRWTIKHYIYLMRKRRNYMPLDGDNFLYDAFVAYNQEDSIWVRDHLLPVLEEEHGLKLCIHERDFQAGVFINDNIVTCIEQSKKIILVLTDTFARSGWCMFELRVAHSKHIEDETDLLVVLLEKVNARNMNESIRTLLETTTYMEWTEDNVGQNLFWNKMKAAINK